MNTIDQIDWGFVWEIISDVVLPHIGRLTFNTILFLIIGLILFIAYVVILSKKGILKRKPKYYNWAVKLYIPIFFFVFIYLFGQIGFIRGVYKILNKENEHIVTGVYEQTLGFAFKTEESKNIFINELQDWAKDAKVGSSLMVEQINVAAKNNNTGIGLIDESKDKLTAYLLEEYGDHIYKIGMYGMLSLAGAKAHVKLNEAIPYDEFSSAMDFLLEVGYKDIELSVKNKLMIWFDTLLNAQYHSLLKSLLIILIVLLCVPFIEFFIYKKWIAPKIHLN